jgi:F0F1-type ATP synthase assembly protein I
VNRPEDDTSRGMAAGYALLTVGITFALAVTGGVLLGVWADRRLGTLPLFTVVGTLLGTGLGGFWAYQRIQSVGKRDDDAG